MAQSVVINGTTYADVPYVVIPKPSNAGDATFYDCSGDDAAAGHVLSGKKFHTSTGDATGSMTNLGSVSDTISTKAGTVTVNEGYTSGGTIQISGTEQAKIISSNILQGVTILGVTGNVQPSSSVQIESSKTVTPTASSQTVLPSSGYDALAQVVVNAVPYAEADNTAGGKTVTIL